MDESGQESKNWVFIAGFIGNEDQWRKFVPAWREGLGNRKSLHMAALRFKKDRERRLLERLAPIPVNCNLEPLLGGIRISDYRDLFVNDTFQEKLNSGFICAFLPLMSQMLRWMPADERVELVFEQQDRYAGVLNFWLNSIHSHLGRELMPVLFTADGKPRIAKWSFVPKGSTCLTEPADYFVYSVAQYYKDKNSRRAQWCLPILRSVDSVSVIGAIMQKEHSRLWVSHTLDKQREENIILPKTNEEFENFRKLASQLIKVSHDELAKRLEAEKKVKKRKKAKLTSKP